MPAMELVLLFVVFVTAMSWALLALGFRDRRR
jgi:hypothetical protein